MSDSSVTDRTRIVRLTDPGPLRERLAADVRRGLTGRHKELPPVYFYDARGSELFERITGLEEYYPTQAEADILRHHGDALVGRVRPTELVELGSGSSAKTGLLLAAMRRRGGRRYVPLDISEDALREAARRLAHDHPWLEVDGYVADFTRDLPAVPRHGRRLLAFLGSTIGNLLPDARQRLLAGIAATLEPGDAFLLGADLVKDVDVLLRAYDDAQGVTAEFNRNVLQVINRELDADLPLDAFAHRAHWDAEGEEIQMHLVATRDVRATIRALDLEVRIEAGEHIVTEHSCKFRVDGLRRELAHVGLDVVEVRTDGQERFAVLLAGPTG